IDPSAVIMVLPSDHFIGDEEGFRALLGRALATARDGTMTTIGVVPTRAETGYGYIEVGAELGPSVYSVARFVEKPDRARAEAYVAGGKHLWNAGMFFFRAGEMLNEIQSHLPDLRAGLAALDEAAARGDEARALKDVFPKMPSISIDHGVMEKAAKLAVV